MMRWMSIHELARLRLTELGLGNCCRAPMPERPDGAMPGLQMVSPVDIDAVVISEQHSDKHSVDRNRYLFASESRPNLVAINAVCEECCSSTTGVRRACRRRSGVVLRPIGG